MYCCDGGNTNFQLEMVKVEVGTQGCFERRHLQIGYEIIVIKA